MMSPLRWLHDAFSRRIVTWTNRLITVVFHAEVMTHLMSQDHASSKCILTAVLQSYHNASVRTLLHCMLTIQRGLKSEPQMLYA